MRTLMCDRGSCNGPHVLAIGAIVPRSFAESSLLSADVLGLSMLSVERTTANRHRRRSRSAVHGFAEEAGLLLQQVEVLHPGSPAPRSFGLRFDN